MHGEFSQNTTQALVHPLANTSLGPHIPIPTYRAGKKGETLMLPVRLETMAFDIPENNCRRIVTGREQHKETLARLDFFGELAEIAKTSPTFQPELMTFLMRSLAESAVKSDSKGEK